jgi:hypothetical protein
MGRLSAIREAVSELVGSASDEPSSDAAVAEISVK